MFFDPLDGQFMSMIFSHGFGVFGGCVAILEGSCPSKVAGRWSDQ